jgi:fatty-acyl-CoA synthase
VRPAPTALHADDDLAARVSCLHLTYGVRRLRQRVRRVDHRRHFAGLDQVREGPQVGRDVASDQRSQALAHEARQEHRHECARAGRSRGRANDRCSAAGLPRTTKHVLSLPELAEQAARESDTRSSELPDTLTETDDALILYTSGTTGKPNGALFDHHRVMWTSVNCIATCGMRVGDRFLHVAPLYHAAELGIMLIPGTMIGATHFVQAGFQPGAVLDALESEHITMFFGVPTMFQFLLRQPDAAQRDLSVWRTGLFGAAPMPASAVEQLVHTWPHVNFMQLCGQTEGGPGGIYCDVEQVKARPDASGRQALLFTEARVVDPIGNEVEGGGVGELILRGETIMKGYWNKPVETTETIRDGWLHTGDLARIDASGYMTLVDRLKDMIITGGENVYSVEVESALAAHPDIADVAVVGRPHPDFGESIVAVVTPREGTRVALEDVKAFCADKIARYKIPHDLVVGTIPRNPSGKILKHQLRERVREVQVATA